MQDLYEVVSAPSLQVLRRCVLAAEGPSDRFITYKTTGRIGRPITRLAYVCSVETYEGDTSVVVEVVSEQFDINVGEIVGHQHYVDCQLLLRMNPDGTFADGAMIRAPGTSRAHEPLFDTRPQLVTS